MTGIITEYLDNVGVGRILVEGKPEPVTFYKQDIFGNYEPKVNDEVAFKYGEDDKRFNAIHVRAITRRTWNEGKN